eukprot:IDg13719t1
MSTLPGSSAFELGLLSPLLIAARTPPAASESHRRPAFVPGIRQSPEPKNKLLRSPAFEPGLKKEGDGGSTPQMANDMTPPPSPLKKEPALSLRSRPPPSTVTDTRSAAATHIGRRVHSVENVSAPPSCRSATMRPYEANPARKAPRTPRSKTQTSADTQLPELSDVLQTYIPVQTHVP